MKKSLVALAVLAASGVSFAQVTISGNLGVSFQKSPVIGAAGAATQGLRVNDGEIYITATEDLGGGMSATARGGITLRGRGSAIGDRDATVTLAGPMGAITAGAVRACGIIDAQKSGAVTGTVYSANETENGVPIDKCSVVDIVALTTKLSDVTVTGTYGEFGSFLSSSTSAALGANGAGNPLGVTFGALAASYAKGPLALGGDYTYFMVTGAGVLKAADGLQRWRAVGSYDFGVAKLAAGYQGKSWCAANQYIASVAVPMGNALFGLDYLMRDAQGDICKGSAADNTALGVAATALGGTAVGDKASSALGVGMTYNFSKTTTVNVSYITYTDVKATATAATTTAFDNEYRIRLMKSF